jgi:hypothetical protein
VKSSQPSFSTGGDSTGLVQVATTCPPSQIKGKDGPFVGGATGEQSVTVALVKSGPGSCLLDGYPRVRLS